MSNQHTEIVCLLVALLGGCASTYTTPGGAVSIPAITEPEIGAALALEPAAHFPARLIVTRVQSPGYLGGYGGGRYSVLLVRDIETQADFVRLGSLPGIAKTAAVNRLFLPSANESARDLRTAAAKLRGDVLLIYTVDTAFHAENKQVGPLQVVTLGFLRNHKVHVTATCSAAFIDVRTGFVYGSAEASVTETQPTSAWSTYNVAETARHTTERAAFVAALDEVEKVWAEIYGQYGLRSGLGAHLQ